MSNRKIYRIKLTDEERDVFREAVKGKRERMNIAAWKVQRARAMLKCDESQDGCGLGSAGESAGTQAEVERRTSEWESDRNTRRKGIDWQFTTDKARTKLKRLYPKVELR